MGIKKGPFGIGQKNMSQGWLLMCIYWYIGIIVGYRSGYFSNRSVWRIPIHGNLLLWYAIGVIVTVYSHQVMRSRGSSFGRPSHVPVALVFGVMNGTIETMIFIALYDQGSNLRKWLLSTNDEDYHYDRDAETSNTMTPTAAATNYTSRKVVGYVVFCLYCAMVHVLFWLPRALPPHLRTDAPPFHKHGLPPLLLMSAAWLLVYEVSNGTLTVPCVLHMYVDYSLATEIGLPGPFSSSEKMMYRT